MKQDAEGQHIVDKLTRHPNNLKTYNTKHRTIKLISNSNTAFQILVKIDRLYLRLKEVSEDDCLTLAGNAFQQSKYL